MNTVRLDNIEIDHLLPGILSAYKSVELFGNATLYTTKEIINKLKKFNLPFTDYIEQTPPDAVPFSPILSKLYTYASQKEPFIHLDLDFILNSKSNLDTDDDNPVRFSHRDTPIHLGFEHMEGIYVGYLRPAYDIGKKYGFNIFAGLGLGEIPNFGIICCSDPESFSQATNKVLGMYRDNLEYFNSGHVGSSMCFLEQGMIHMHLRRISKQYDESVRRQDNFVFKLDNILNFDQKENHIELIEPLSKNLLTFTDGKDLLNTLDLDKYHSYHFLGNSKSLSLSQSLVIGKLLTFMTEHQIVDLERNFDTRQRNFFTEYTKLIS